MYYKYGGSHFGTMTDTNRYARMYRSDNLEFVVNQSIWFEGETKVRRHHPAGLHQLRALGHQRVRATAAATSSTPSTSATTGWP